MNTFGNRDVILFFAGMFDVEEQVSFSLFSASQTTDSMQRGPPSPHSTRTWFLIVDAATGEPYKRSNADVIALPPGSLVAEFRKAVHREYDKPNYLKDIPPSALLVYKNRAAFNKRIAAIDIDIDKGEEEPLEDDSVMNGLGASKKEALIVVVPSSRSSSRTTSESNLTTRKQPTESLQSRQDAEKNGNAPLVVNDLKLIQLDEEIKAFEDNEEYAEKNRPWAVPEPTEQQNEEWQLPKEELDDMKNKIHSAKKSDKTRKKKNKNDIAIQHERWLLSDVAIKMWERFRFKCENEEMPSFVDLKRASGFKDDEDVRAYFRKKAKGEVKEDELKDFFPESEWIFLIVLYYRVNVPLNDRLVENKDGSLRLVLEEEFYHGGKDVAENLVHKIYGPEKKVNVICAESE